MTSTKSSAFSKLSTAQKWVVSIAATAIALTTIGKFAVETKRYTQNVFKDYAKEIAIQSSLESRKQIQELGFTTTEDLAFVLDTLLFVSETNQALNDTFHKQSYLNYKEIKYAIGDAKYSDSSLQKRIDKIQDQLDALRGIAELTREEQAAQAYTDSLITENIRLKQKELYRARMRQDELEFNKLQRDIRDLSKNVVIDKGRRKTIRTKQRGAKRGPFTDGDRSLFQF